MRVVLMKDGSRKAWRIDALKSGGWLLTYPTPDGMIVADLDMTLKGTLAKQKAFKEEIAAHQSDGWVRAIPSH